VEPGHRPRGCVPFRTFREHRRPPRDRRPAIFFTFPEDARWNAERQAVEFGVEIGGYCGVVRVPRWVFEQPASSAARARAGSITLVVFSSWEAQRNGGLR